jgi:hypothetical protein
MDSRLPHGWLEDIETLDERFSGPCGDQLQRMLTIRKHLREPSDNLLGICFWGEGR